MSDTLATWLNTEVNRRGWTLRGVAKKAGVSHTTIYKIANSERKPKAETCRALAIVFGLDPAEVLRMAGHLPPLASRDSAPFQSDGPDLTVLIDIWNDLASGDRRLLVEMAERLRQAGARMRVVGEEE